MSWWTPSRSRIPTIRGAPPQSRQERIGALIRSVLTGQEQIEDVVRRGTRLSPVRPPGRQPTEVRIDNETSDRYTILDVFADDRQGLLYVMTHAIFVQGLSVHAARISTRLDQAADVFYVTDAKGQKIEDPGQIERIRQGVRQQIDAFLGAIAA